MVGAVGQLAGWQGSSFGAPELWPRGGSLGSGRAGPGSTRVLAERRCPREGGGAGVIMSPPQHVRHPKVLVLTHEEEALEAQLPYHSIRLRPCVALELIGRCAKRDPPCRPKDACFYFWRDARSVQGSRASSGPLVRSPAVFHPPTPAPSPPTLLPLTPALPPAPRLRRPHPAHS